MDLKIVCLLFGCLLSIALAQGEEEDGDGGSQEKGPSEECNCDRRRGGHGWGRRGGKGGEKKCFPIFGSFIECKELNEKFCENLDKEEMKKCWKMETFDNKHECMVRTMQVARDSFEGSFPDCLNAVSQWIDPNRS